MMEEEVRGPDRVEIWQKLFTEDAAGACERWLEPARFGTMEVARSDGGRVIYREFTDLGPDLGREVDE